MRTESRLAYQLNGWPYIIDVYPDDIQTAYDIEKYTEKYPHAVPVQAPAKGKMLWQIDVEDASTAPAAGTAVEAGKPCGYVQTWYGMEEIVPAVNGRVVAVTGKQGKEVAKGEIVAFVQE